MPAGAAAAAAGTVTETVTVIQWRPARSSSLGPAEPTGCLRAPSRPAAACVDSELRLQPGPAPGRALPAPRRPGDFIKIPAAAWASPASPARPTTRNRGRHVAIRLSGPERSSPARRRPGPGRASCCIRSVVMKSSIFLGLTLTILFCKVSQGFQSPQLLKSATKSSSSRALDKEKLVVLQAKKTVVMK